MAPKIATCCYCGHRAALVLTGRGGHELACASCGAPLHNLKSMPLNTQPSQREQHPASVARGASTPREAAPAEITGAHRRKAVPTKPPKRAPKKRKSGLRRAFSEVFDFVEDIFD